MTELVDLNSRRAPVVYTVTIAHHYDGNLEFLIEDVGDDERSREAVFHAFRRISGAEDRIEKLEAVTKDDARWLAAYHKWCEMNGCAPSSSDLIAAREALEGKDE
jgi:hypothetical protein